MESFNSMHCFNNFYWNENIYSQTWYYYFSKRYEMNIDNELAFQYNFLFTIIESLTWYFCRFFFSCKRNTPNSSFSMWKDFLLQRFDKVNARWQQHNLLVSANVAKENKNGKPFSNCNHSIRSIWSPFVITVIDIFKWIDEYVISLVHYLRLRFE